MTEKNDHTVLIVDDEQEVGTSLGRLLKKAGIKYVYMESGAEALERVKTASTPFSMIISDQRMPGMNGSEFLEKAKEISPDTIRFLITGYADIDAVTEAVNKGSIHRYIAKPWENKVLLESVKSGLEQYELVQENNRLFLLAKEQNAKLYTLNCDLKDSTVNHKKTLETLDKEIMELNKTADRGFDRDHLSEIETIFKEKEMLTTEKMNSFYAVVVSELFEQFQDIAARNGFEMPEER